MALIPVSQLYLQYLRSVVSVSHYGGEFNGSFLSLVLLIQQSSSSSFLQEFEFGLVLIYLQAVV